MGRDAVGKDLIKLQERYGEWHVMCPWESCCRLSQIGLDLSPFTWDIVGLGDQATEVLTIA
jgi:hypothetical protein